MPLRPLRTIAEPSYPSSWTWGLKRVATTVACSASLAMASCSGASAVNPEAPRHDPQAVCAEGAAAFRHAEPNENTQAVEIRFTDEMSDFIFRPIRLLLVLDGQCIALWAPGEDGDREPSAALERTLFQGPLAEGVHGVDVYLEYNNIPRGPGYPLSLRFQIVSHHSFDVEESQTGVLEIRAYESGNPTTPIEERPAVDFEWRSE